MAKKKKPGFSDPFSTHEEILDRFFTHDSGGGSDDKTGQPETVGEDLRTEEAPAQISEPVMETEPDEEGMPVADTEQFEDTDPVAEAEPAEESESTSDTASEDGPGIKEYLEDFFLEYNEHVEVLDSSLLMLEANPEAYEELNTCFRQIHNLKGISNAMGFERLSGLCHDIESLLAGYRESRAELPEALINALFNFNDLLRAGRDEIKKSCSDEGLDTGDIVERIQAVVNENPPDQGSKEPVETEPIKPKLLAVFLQELGENIEIMDSALLQLEKEPEEGEQLNAVFRIIHNTKGISNSLKLERLSTLAHTAETTLTDFRDGGATVNQEFIDLFFEFNDMLRDFKGRLENTATEGDIETGPLMKKLMELHQKPAQAESQALEMDDERRQMLENYMPDFLLEYGEHIEVLDVSTLKLEKDHANVDELNTCFRQIHNMKGMSNALGFSRLGGLCHAVETALVKYREKKEPLPKGIIDLFFEFTDILRRFKKNLESDMTEGDIETSTFIERIESVAKGGSAPAKQKPPSTEPAKEVASIASVTEKITTIRVNVRRLDDLMNSVGELVLLRNRYNQLSQRFAKAAGTEKQISDFNSLAGQLDMVTGSIQSAVMRTRMQPVGAIFSKFHRVVRDLCRALGKEADLIISGAETELDKNLIEAISDPLMHIIRNCMDHGLESPEDRMNAGKPGRGSIKLNAFQEGHSIIIEVTDDGRGIDPEVIKRLAVEKGLLDVAAAEGLSEADKLALIFHPGFSTAKKVSDVSGRGVGMDVVKTNIEQLKGQIDLQSEVGVGAGVKIRIPLTLAIMQTLLCQVKDERFALPLFSVMETIRIEANGIEQISGAPVVRLRDEILPVVFLRKLLALDDDGDDASSHQQDVVVLKIGIKQVGLVVDRTIGQEEVLIKPLDVLKDIFEPAFLSGATILGDGAIALILDVAQIMKEARLMELEVSEVEKKAGRLELEELILLLDDGGVERYGIELKGINNIDIIEEGHVKRVGSQEVVKYNSEILPITRIPYITGFSYPSYKDKLYLVVVSHEGRKAGLLVNELCGLRKIKRKDLQKSAGRLDMDSALIIQDQVTIIISLGQVIDSASEKRSVSFQTTIAPAPTETTMGKALKVLVVDDSMTHRNVMRELLTDAGYKVTLADGAKAGMKDVANVDLVITDLDMPDMNGYEFTTWVKGKYPNKPVIMLTNYSGEENVSLALEAGVDHFLVKLDAENLLKTISGSERIGS